MTALSTPDTHPADQKPPSASPPLPAAESAAGQGGLPAGAGPMLARRRLRERLRRLREQQGLTVGQAADRVGWSRSRFTRVEGGQTAATAADLAALMDLYAVTDPQTAGQLRRLADAARRRMWWHTYPRYAAADWWWALIEAEHDATRIWDVQPTIMPALVQTAAYATAVGAATGQGVTAPGVALQVDVLLQRQRHLQAGGVRRQVTVVVDEAVLHRPVGGPQVAAEQLDHLADVAEQDTIAVVVLPWSVGAHPGLAGPFTVMEYADPADTCVVLADAADGRILHDQTAAIVADRRQATHLAQIGVGGAAAGELIRRARTRLPDG